MFDSHLQQLSRVASVPAFLHHGPFRKYFATRPWPLMLYLDDFFFEYWMFETTFTIYLRFFTRLIP